MLQVHDDVNFDARTESHVLCFLHQQQKKKQKAGYDIITILPMCKYKEYGRRDNKMIDATSYVFIDI